MEKYRKTVKTRVSLLVIPVLAAVALVVYDIFFASETVAESHIFGFQLGMATGLGLVATVLIIRLSKALKDDALLKLQYNKENDERYKAIRAKAGMPMLLISSVGMIVAGIIAGYFNTTVFATLIAAAMSQMVFGGIIKQIYMRKM